MSSPEYLTPCTACGACCAYFRVSFYWSEADPAAGGQVPPEWIIPLDRHRVVMRGTEQEPVRCLALEGSIGTLACCRIYASRPSVCREFAVSWENGAVNEACDRARAAWGLPPLAPPDLGEPDGAWRAA